MITSFRAVSCGVIFVLLVGTSSSNACCRIKVNIGPVHIDTGRPLQPVRVDPVVVPGGTVTPPAPGLVPTTPSVQLDPAIPGADIVNKADDLAHKPEQMAQEGLNAAGRGIEHLGNEIGMLWAHAKQDAVDWADDAWQQLLAFLKAYLPLVVGALVGGVALAAAMGVYFSKAMAGLFRSGARPRKERERLA